MRIQTNVSALSAQNKLAVTQAALQTSTTRLSSGFRINRAADDAAGLSIANQMRGDIRSLQTAQRNASQASSMLQIADGATGTIASILDRMKELATQAASDNTSTDARLKLQDEFGQLQLEIDRIVDSTKFQGKALLDGTFGLAIGDASTLTGYENLSVPAETGMTYTLSVTGGSGSPFVFSMTATDADGNVSDPSTVTIDDTVAADTSVKSFSFAELGVSFTFEGDASALAGTIVAEASGGTFRVGLGTEDDSTISLALSGLSTNALGIGTGVNLEDMDAAAAAIEALDDAYVTVNSVIGQIGAATNRLEFASTNLSSIIQNTMAAESTIRDADMAYEMMQFSKQNILAQAGTAMLAQANSLSQSVLQLLR